ncbi:unnamed protein product [Rhizophagus irregularis]|nr:unnamed protein product [Rhizophagus irregularis]
MSVSEAIPSELEVLRQRNAELEAKSVELENVKIKAEFEAKIVSLEGRNSLHEGKIYELRAKNTDLVFENSDLKNKVAKLEREYKSTVEDLKRKDTDLENRLAKVEQGSPLKDEQPQVKTLTVEESDVDVKRVSDKVVEQTQPREKKIHFEIVPSSGQGRNSHKKKGTEKIVQALADANQGETNQRKSDTSSEIMQVTEISATARRPNSSSTLRDLAQLFDKASNA